MVDRTTKGGMLAKSLITHYKKERTEHYTLVDLLSTVKYIIKVPKTKKVLCVGICVLLIVEGCGVFWWWGCHSKEEVRFQVVDIASAIRDCASSLSSNDK